MTALIVMLCLLQLGHGIEDNRFKGKKALVNKIKKSARRLQVSSSPSKRPTR